ncbi:MAG: hypothetical protein JSU77_07490 [Fidelibacterota bacterium]|nr:MAG: hypothetical protein JSU77_07490 [Candidatus Neomarinimicrobiota bacterium]
MDFITTIFDGIGGLLPKASTTTWVFVLVALLLVMVFTNSGPKKLFALLVGIALFFLSSKGRRLYLMRKLRKVNEAFKKVQDSTAERNETIEKNNGIIRDLESQMADLRPEIKADKEQLDQLEAKIAVSREKYENALLNSEAKVAVALEMAEKVADKLPYSSVADQIRAKYGLPARTVAPSQPPPPVADPAPPSARKDAIVINGFTMKGDV